MSLNQHESIAWLSRTDYSQVNSAHLRSVKHKFVWWGLLWWGLYNGCDRLGDFFGNWGAYVFVVFTVFNLLDTMPVVCMIWVDWI